MITGRSPLSLTAPRGKSHFPGFYFFGLSKIPHFIERTVKRKESHFHLTVLIYNMITELACHKQKDKLFSAFVTKTKA